MGYREEGDREDDDGDRRERRDREEGDDDEGVVEELIEDIGEELEEALGRVGRVEWVKLPEPERLHDFLYSRRSFLLCVVAAIIAYVVTWGQPEDMRRVLAVFVFAAGSWLFEVFPIYITGLMIPLLLTFLGIFEPEEAFVPFAHPVVFLMIGGLVLGQAITRHGLDKRMAYALLTWSRGNSDRLVLYLMLGTMLISMWMSNTVAIAILLPMILSVVASIPEEMVNLRRKVLMGMVVGTTLGGMMMLTGSTPNLIAAAALEGETPFGFSQWAYYGLPVGLVTLALAYVALGRLYPVEMATLDIGEVERQRREAGDISMRQRGVITIFCMTVFLWFWGDLVESWLGLSPSVSSAAMVSILAVLVMFGFGLLDMRDVKSIRWEIIFLLGGGLLLGEAMISSGAAAEIGVYISRSEAFMPSVAIVLAFILLTLLLTSFISNAPTAAVLIPIGIQTAEVLGVDPTVFVMAIGLTATVAFITPVGSPSTAMIYSTGQVPRRTLLRDGLVVGVICALVTLAVVWLLPVP